MAQSSPSMTDAEALAMLDSQPGVRTATRPGDVRVEQQYVPNDGSVDTRIDVNRVSGPIAHMQGSWWLLPQDGGQILLVYELALDPGMPIPRFMVRATLKRDLPKLVAAVRDRAEAASSTRSADR